MSETMWGALISLGGVIIALLSSNFFGTRKDRYDMKRNQTSLSLDLKGEIEQKFQIFSRNLQEALALQNPSPEVARDSFYNLRSAGDSFLSTIEKTAALIIDGQIEIESHNNYHYDEIKRVAYKVIPDYYETLFILSDSYSLNCTDCLEKDKFQSVRMLLKGNLDEDAFEELMTIWSKTEGRAR